MTQKSKSIHSITIEGVTFGTQLTLNLNTDHIGIGNSIRYNRSKVQRKIKSLHSITINNIAFDTRLELNLETHQYEVDTEAIFLGRDPTRKKIPEHHFLIDWKMTGDITGNGEGYFIKRPKSIMSVYVLCPVCGTWRWIQYQFSGELCQSCLSKQ